MACRHCGHPLDNHTDDGARCRVTVLTGWDQAAGKFTGARVCICPGYQPVTRLPVKMSKTGCPHECLPGGEHPLRCVHCGTITTNSGKR